MNISQLVKLIKECDDADLPELRQRLMKLKFDLFALIIQLKDIEIEMGKQHKDTWKAV